MEIILAVGVIMLIAYLVIKAECSLPNPPLNGGAMFSMTVNAEPARGLGTGRQENGCMLILAIIGMLTFIAGLLWLNGMW